MSRSSEAMPHLTDERIQDWLDGRLSASEAARIEEHVDGCPRCRAEVEGWRSLMGDLSVLGELSPRSGFGGRVLDAVGGSARERISLAARVRSWLATPPHVDPVRLQEFVDGTLGRRRAGDKVKLTVQREGAEIVVEAELDRRPHAEAAPDDKMPIPMPGPDGKPPEPKEGK